MCACIYTRTCVCVTGVQVPEPPKSMRVFGPTLANVKKQVGIPEPKSLRQTCIVELSAKSQSAICTYDDVSLHCFIARMRAGMFSICSSCRMCARVSVCQCVCERGGARGNVWGVCWGGAFMGSVCVCVTLQMFPVFTVILSTDLPNSHSSGLTHQSSRRKGERRPCRNQEGHNCVLCEQMENRRGLISAAFGTLHDGQSTANARLNGRR